MPDVQLGLTEQEIGDLITSLDYSIRNIRDWHAGPQGSPATASVGRENVARLERLRDKLRTSKAARPGA